MAWTTPKTWASGYVVLAADLNTHLRDNLNLTAPGVMSAQGDIVIASGANTPIRLAKSTTSTQYLANTGTSNAPAWNEVALATGVSGILPVGNGGLGISLSGVATGGVAAGSGSGTWAVVTTGTTALSEGGTDSTARLWAASHLKEAVEKHGLSATPAKIVAYSAASLGIEVIF